MRRKMSYLYTTLLCVSLCWISGCWSSTELSQRSFARILLVDHSEEGIELTLGFPLPNQISSISAGGGSSGSQKEPFAFVTKSGENIGEAYRKIQSDLPREITFGHLKGILIGNKLAEQGIQPIVDFLMRIPNVHIDANVYVTKAKANEFIKASVIFERFPSDLLTKYEKENVAINMTIKDMLMSIYSEGDFLLPIIVFADVKPKTTNEEKSWVGTGGAALLKQGRRIGTLTIPEMTGSQWVISQINDDIVTIPSPTDGKEIIFRIQNSKTQIKPVLNGEQITFLINCKANATLYATESVIDVTDLRELRQIEKKLEDKIEQRIDSAITKTRKARADALHFGQYIEWRYPMKWKHVKNNWRETYATEVRMKPQIHINIKWISSVRNPSWNRLLPSPQEASQ